MITADRMARVDANAAALGVPRKQLMESSGNAVARVVRDLVDPGGRVVLVCGRGNNGGDGFVAARFLRSYDTETVLLGRPSEIGTEIAAENWEALNAAELSMTTIGDSTHIEDLDLDSADCVVDAMLGTGIRGALREPTASAAVAINATDATVVAVDVPSGVDSDTGDAAGRAVEADHIVTFHDTKPGLAELDTPVTVADIGIPAAAERFVGPGDLPDTRRAPASHKGDHGELLVVGGGPYTGAPALAGQAALRAGADLVHIACPAPVADRIQGYSENLIVHSFDGERLTPAAVEFCVDLAAEVDCVVCGPGLGDHPDTLAAVGAFLSSVSGRVVVDADALAVVPDVDTDAKLLCTPHQGELVSMGGETATDWQTRAALVDEFATELGVTLLVKGAYDIASAPNRSTQNAARSTQNAARPTENAGRPTTRVNRTGTPAMTVGGTGDVLSGVVGSLFTRHDSLTASAVGAYVTGLAGERASETRHTGLVATDLLDWLPESFERTNE